MHTDGMLKRSMGPFVDALSNYFQLYQHRTDEAKKDIFDTIYGSMLSALSKDDKHIPALLKDLKRTKSVICCNWPALERQFV